MITVPPLKVWLVSGHFIIEAHAETAEDAKKIVNELELFEGDVEVFNVTVQEKTLEQEYGS
jgi:hypothetical protein